MERLFLPAMVITTSFRYQMSLELDCFLRRRPAYGCIDFVKRSGVFDRSKNFCTRLGGDSGAVFAALEAAFCRFGPPAGHVTIDLTVSANRPTPR